MREGSPETQDGEGERDSLQGTGSCDYGAQDLWAMSARWRPRRTHGVVPV